MLHFMFRSESLPNTSQFVQRDIIFDMTNEILYFWRLRFVNLHHSQKFEWFPVEFVDGEITVAHNTLFTDNMLSVSSMRLRHNLIWKFVLKMRVYFIQISNIILDESTCILGNGIKQQVIAINDEYPGPNIEVLAGSLLHVKVINNLYGGVSPSIHWHGIQMKNGFSVF